MFGRKRDVSELGLLPGNDFSSSKLFITSSFRDKYSSNDESFYSRSWESKECLLGESPPCTPPLSYHLLVGENIEAGAFKLGTDYMESVTCCLCSNIIFMPVSLMCGHSYCRGCLLHHLNLSNHDSKNTSSEPVQCPSCLENSYMEDVNFGSDDAVSECEGAGWVPRLNSAIQLRIDALFPYYDSLRRVLNHVGEKRLFYELNGIRTRVLKLRQLFIREKREKLKLVEAVSHKFRFFIEKCSQEAKLSKQYEKELAALHAMEAEMETKMNSYRGYRCSEITSPTTAHVFEDDACCLVSSTEKLKSIVDSGADTYEAHCNSANSSVAVFRCTRCHKLLAL